MTQIQQEKEVVGTHARFYQISTSMRYGIVALLAFFVGIQFRENQQPWSGCPSISCYVPQCAQDDSTVLGAADVRESIGGPISVADDQRQRLMGDLSAVGNKQSQMASLPSISDDLRSALEVMQTSYFELWLGIWPEAIDWTAAVMNTLLSASLSSLARASGHAHQTTSDAGGHTLHLSSVDVENEMNRYFAHSIGYYFREDAFAIRLQAYDDMLWVVLGWLESIKHIRQRTLHRARRSGPTDDHERRSSTTSNAWFGNQFVPIFAHRARVFYDLAKGGYDYSLCGGGMLWNPSLLPYKNAITNELFIAASVGMYLYFPGDDNDSPFAEPNDLCLEGPCPSRHPDPLKIRAEATEDGMYDVAFLRAAVEGYTWLKNSNMTNSQGLYVDGFHIKDYGVNGTIGTGQCDIRNEMVYTYNQGVLLSGLRGLWEGTGQRKYLEDGHDLVKNVINATGWDLYKEPHLQPGWAGRWKWHGLGRAGILEEQCDAAGTCNQDAQTFKGIFFHHLTLFCEPLPRWAAKPGKTFAGDRDTAFLHRSSCAEYREWVVRNAKAAMGTRNGKGEYGMWWTWGLSEDSSETLVGLDAELMEERMNLAEKNSAAPPGRSRFAAADSGTASLQEPWSNAGAAATEPDDPNSRFRGRTVETQGGGLAVVRAMYEFSTLR